MGQQRHDTIDGIRGWAAISVVLFHLTYETFGAIFPLFRTWPVYVVLDGTLAVAIFFVLSGQALSSSYLAKRDRAIIDRLALKRYSRLTIPILTASSLTLILLELHLTSSSAAAAIVGRQDWLGVWLHFQPGAASFLGYGLYDVYASQNPPFNYNVFLWTMQIELAGSALVFVTLYIWHCQSRPWPWLAVVLAVINLAASSLLACFFFGIAFEQLRKMGTLEALRNNRAWQIASAFALIALAAIDARYPYFMHRPAILIVWAVALTFLFQTNHATVNFFSARISRFAGRLSFPLYLIQFPILVSFTSALIVWAHAQHQLNAGVAVLIAFASFLCCLLAAWAFLPVERLTSWVGAKLVQTFLARGQSAAQTPSDNPKEPVPQSALQEDLRARLSA